MRTARPGCPHVLYIILEELDLFIVEIVTIFV